MSHHNHNAQGELSGNRTMKLSVEQKEQVLKTLGTAIYGHGRNVFELDVEKNDHLAQNHSEISEKKGKHASMHDVFFATTTGIGSTSTIAVKRFNDHEGSQGELDAMRETRARGFWTFEPVGKGVYDLDHDLGSALVTQYVPRIKTMNTVEWWSHFDNVNGKPVNDVRLRSMAEFVGQMHSNGIIHGDLQLKNIARRSAVGYVVIDLEDATFYDPHTKDEAEKGLFADKCMDDLTKLISSLAEKGYLTGFGDREFQEQVEDNFLLPYLSGGNLEGLFNHSHFKNLIQEAVLAHKNAPHYDSFGDLDKGKQTSYDQEIQQVFAEYLPMYFLTSKRK